MWMQFGRIQNTKEGWCLSSMMLLHGIAVDFLWSNDIIENPFSPTIEISEAEQVGNISRLPVIDSSSISQLGLCPIIISVHPSSILSTIETRLEGRLGIVLLRWILVSLKTEAPYSPKSVVFSKSY